MALVQIVGSTRHDGAGTTIGLTTPGTAPIPAGTQEGDVLIFAWASYTSSGESYSFMLSPEDTAAWTFISGSKPGVPQWAGTLVMGVWAATYTSSLNLRFLGSHSDRRVMPTTIALRGVKSIADITPGELCKRATYGTDTTTVAKSMLTTSQDNLVLAIFAERTSAVETDIVSLDGANRHAFFVDTNGAPVENILYAYQEMTAPGATSDVTVTYPNIQPSNGFGVQIAVPHTSSVVAEQPMEPASVVGTANITGVEANMSAIDGVFVPLPTEGVLAGDKIVFVPATYNANSFDVTPVDPTGWTRIGARNAVGTLLHTVWAAEYSPSLNLEFRSNYPTSGTGRRTTPASIVIRGGAPISDWIIGGQGLRSTAGDGYTTIAPGITTTSADTFILGVFTERTTAQETDVTSVTNSQKIAFLYDPAYQTVETVLFTGHLDSVPGSTGDVSVLYPNVQTSNGVGQLFGIPAGEVEGPAFATGYFKNANGDIVEAALAYVTETGPQFAKEIHVIRNGYANVQEFLADDEIYIAHRGGSYSFPEMSLHAYTQAAVRGFGALEFSASRTSDGVWFGLHDQTLLRTSGVDIDPTGMTWAEVQQYMISPAVAGGNQNQPARPYMSLEQLMDIYGQSHVIVFDPKYQNTAVKREAMFTELEKYGGADRFVLKYYFNNTPLVTAANQRGYSSWGYLYSSDIPTLSTYAPPWTLLGFPYGAPQADWNQVLAVGKRVLAHICPDQAAVNAGKTAGATGFMVSGTATVTPV